ncbi:membrane protein insertase YidC [Bacteroidales bacterium]|nr:membrane protein insertase YidC [Bacteroidales bacterium]
MDKKTLIGFLLIGAILFTFTWLNQPTPEQIESQRKYQDSIAVVDQVQQKLSELSTANELQHQAQIISQQPDSIREQELQNNFGSFFSAAQGEETFVNIENEFLSIQLSTKGGRIFSSTLKNYTNSDSLPLTLFDNEESSFGLVLVTANNRVLNTKDLYFEAIELSKTSATMRLHAQDGAYMDFIYSLNPNDYMMRFEIGSQGLSSILPSNTNSLDLVWTQYIRQQEVGRRFEEQHSALFYKFLVDDVENLSESKDDTENISNKLKWIGYKDQFFSSVLIPDEDFSSAQLESNYFKEGTYLKKFTSSTSIAFDPSSDKNIGFNFFFGPNQYSLLKGYRDNARFEGQNLELEKLVYLGMSVFRYVNQWIVIPLFDFFTGMVGSIGLAIFLLTLTIKMGLFPLTYKSFMSSAKMRVMRPQIEELNDKYPGQDNAMTRQQKTMALYRQAGVNPMSGCLPMLLQMPFLFALFMFFPSAIELRHESFLWAHDLSTYDAIFTWDTYIPLISPYFGNHISLFCLLMTATNIVYTKFNMEMTNTGQQQMPGMKAMMYVMPLFMLVFLNQYPAGLNYYYFLSTLITIIQTLVFRYLVNEDKILAKLEANKLKPAKKKSGFMARLEEAQRVQQQQQAAKQKGGNKKK